MKFDVVGIGAAKVDHMNVVERFPKRDEKIVPLSSSIQGGGQAANAIACLARLGAKTAFIGAIGCGEIGTLAKDSLDEEGVDTKAITIHDDCAPAISTIIVEKKTGRRTIIADRGDISHIQITDKGLKAIENAKIIHSDVHFPGEDMTLIKHARKNKVKVSLDLEPHVPNCEKFIKYADILVVSSNFADDRLSKDYEKALKMLMKSKPDVAVITLNKKGSIGMQKGDKKIYKIPAYDAGKVVDHTGAGDIFHGAFLYGYLQKWDIVKSMKFANVCAGMKCTKIGGRAGMPKLKDALKNLENWKI